MTNHIEAVRSRSVRIAPRAALALGMTVLALAVAVSACAMEARGEPTRATAADDSANATAVLAAVRGESPLACAMTARTLENRWGSRQHLGGPDAAALDDAQSAAFDWVMSDRSGGDDVLPLLQRAMADADACVRRTAAQLVGRIGGVGLAARLRPELGAADAVRREMAALALGYSGEKTAEPALARLAADAEPRVRRTVAWALGRTDNDVANAPLVTMLGDGDAMVRVNAALSLGRRSARAAIPRLSELLSSDRDARVRRAAAGALGQIDKD